MYLLSFNRDAVCHQIQPAKHHWSVGMIASVRSRSMGGQQRASSLLRYLHRSPIAEKLVLDQHLSSSVKVCKGHNDIEAYAIGSAVPSLSMC